MRKYYIKHKNDKEFPYVSSLAEDGSIRKRMNIEDAQLFTEKDILQFFLMFPEKSSEYDVYEVVFNTRSPAIINLSVD